MNMVIEVIKLVALFIIPVLLVYHKIIPFKYRIHALAAVTSLTIAAILLEGWTLADIGIRADTLGRYAIPYIVFTVILVVVLIIMAKILKKSRRENFFWKKRFIYIAVISSISQELMFRGYLYAKLQEILSDPYIIILINALLFTFIHIIYSNTPWTLLMIFVAGICFTGMYWLYPNLILLIISHTILNYIAVYNSFYYEKRKGVVEAGKISFEG